jgi:UDP-N-acetylglucosamine 1-carboxyvinyltransferase
MDRIRSVGGNRLNGIIAISGAKNAALPLMIAGLAAEGETMVNRVYHLERGFDRLEEKLKAWGAAIERISD